MECPYCNAENRDGTRYCGSCGKFIGSSPTAPTAGTTSNTPTPPGSSRSLAVGSRLQGGRYVVKKVLGQGGMGAALLATDIRLDGKLVVIKELISDNTDPTRQQEDVRNFKREVATLAHIDHPLVPNVTDHFQEGSRYFMVQEYVDGENLEERLDRTNQPMKEREALICASEILDVLDYLAQQTPPIVHRDIKPANIIIGNKDKRAHLVDFGIARAEVVRNAQRKQTAALGTPGYAPPEQYQGNADPRSDLYALAATLHHLLTNRDPRNHPPFNYPPVRALNPQLSPEIERVLVKALTNDINQRYQSAAAMKQEIDSILRQRFGMSGNIDSYTLGTANTGNSGAMSPVTAQNTQAGATMIGGMSQTNVPTYISQPGQTVAGSSMTPVQPLPQLFPPQSGGMGPVNYGQPSGGMAPIGYPVTPGTMGTIPPVQKKRRRWPVFVIVLLIVLLLLATGGYFLLPYLHPAQNTGIGVTKRGNENIGISDGTYAFDTTLADGSLKAQAADQLRQSKDNLNQATSLFNQALNVQQNDAEALIYKEDLRVVNSGAPYVTVVVATMLSGPQSLITVGRDDLQGAYVAQKEYNDGAKLHNGTLVRLLIANSGGDNAYTKDVAQQIVQLAQADKTFVGVMGWPHSDRMLSAIQTLGPAQIPMVSQTASTDALTGASPYFFRVAPSNKTQGIQGAKYAEQTLHVRNVVIFSDRNNLYSQTLADDFSQQFKADGGNVVAQENYTVGKRETIPSGVQDAEAKHPDLIYFAGYSSDVKTLLTDLSQSTVPVLGGDALYELGGYESGIRPPALTHLYFTSFAYPDEWDVQHLTTQKPAFFIEYINDFGNGSAPGTYGYTRADNDVILSYDATTVILQACNSVLSGGKQTVSPQDLQRALKGVNGANAFQGVSGVISFGPDGNPVDKAVVVLHVDDMGHIHLDTIVGSLLKGS